METIRNNFQKLCIPAFAYWIWPWSYLPTHPMWHGEYSFCLEKSLFKLVLSFFWYFRSRDRRNHQMYSIKMMFLKNYNKYINSKTPVLEQGCSLEASIMSWKAWRPFRWCRDQEANVKFYEIFKGFLYRWFCEEIV